MKQIMTVVVGPEGVGKTTVLQALQGEAGFPKRLLVEHELTESDVSEAIKKAISHREAFVIESRLEEPDTIIAMQHAKERGFEIELIVIGVEDEAMLNLRRKTRRRADELTWFRVPSAVDQADRVLVMDNSIGPTVALKIAAAQIQGQKEDSPSWITNRILSPKIERALSREVMRKAHEQIRAQGNSQTVLRVARSWQDGHSTGAIVAKDTHYALQSVGNALHVLHDLAVLPPGIGLAKQVVASISYSMANGQSLAREAVRGIERGLSR